jgi:OFA family oxalate/formate antiporter-like MFS transporter
VFLVMFLTQAVVFYLLSRVHSFGGLAVLAFIVLLCYGGGFGTMPAFAADFFGARDVGSIYGLMLTAWGLAGLLGPALIAFVRERTGYYTEALVLIAGIMLVSSLLPFVIRPPTGRKARSSFKPGDAARLPMPARAGGVLLDKANGNSG